MLKAKKSQHAPITPWPKTNLGGGRYYGKT